MKYLQQNLTNSKLLFLALICASFSMHGMDGAGAHEGGGQDQLQITKHCPIPPGGGTVVIDGHHWVVNRRTAGKTVQEIRDMVRDALPEFFYGSCTLRSSFQGTVKEYEYALKHPYIASEEQFYTSRYEHYNLVPTDVIKARYIQKLQETIRLKKGQIRDLESHVIQMEREVRKLR